MCSRGNMYVLTIERVDESRLAHRRLSLSRRVASVIPHLYPTNKADVRVNLVGLSNCEVMSFVR